MLRNKLFLIIVSILSVTLIATGFISFKNINEVFNAQIQKDINKDKKELNSYFKKINDDLFSLIDEISKNEDLKSSLNLISLYEDPNDYVKETFDFEKNNLIELSNKWIKDSSHYSISLFNNDMNLIMIHRNLDQHRALGYITYTKNGKKEFFDYESKKTTKTPFFDKIDKKYLDQFSLEFFAQRFLISYLKQVKLDGDHIGYIKLTTCIDTDVLKSLNESLSLTTLLHDQNNNYLFPSKKEQNSFKNYKSSDDVSLIKSELLNFGNKLYSVSLVDKTLIKEKQKNIIFTMVEIFVVLLIFIFAISAFFINRTILKPISNLKETIDNIKKGKRSKITNITSKDEISDIVNDFTNLSMDLSKNLAFLESYELAMDESSIVTKADLKGKITYVNENFCKITGYTKEEAIGKPHSIVRHPDSSKEIFKELWDTIKSKKVWKGILKNKGKLDDYWVDISILPILDENKEVVEYIAIRHDITKMINQQKELDNIANTDILTGLGNRYKLNNEIKSSKSPAIAILNIDNFSQVNDFYGHDTGDYIIKQIGVEISKLLTHKDFDLYHLQGDEYVIFNPDIKKDLFIESIYKLNNQLSKISVTLKDDILSFNFSTALSFEDKQNILSTADMALKVAKRDNKELVIYSQDISLNDEYENNIKWTKKIKDALENDKFLPVFQPLVNNSNEKWEKYECLVRMEDDDKLISPYFFLDISKKTKHYTDITKVMLNKSFEMFKDKDLEFSVNLTIEDILNSDIKFHIILLLEQYQNGSKVVFEIVESESIENFEEVLQFIKDVQEYGCKIAIDDFGTGYSNFEYLVQLQADYLKIDGSLIKDIDTSETSQIVVKNLVNFAKDLGMKTIAEFVENESILKKVKELGIDYSQGYYYSAPKKELNIDNKL